MDQKQSLRIEKLEQFRQLSMNRKTKIELKQQEQLFSSPLWSASRRIGITISTTDEWNTYPIIEKAWSQGKKVASPKCIAKTKEMDFYEWNGFDRIQTGYAGIMEPLPREADLIEASQIDLLIVPGVVFDFNGYRIGFGGGYYDRMLATFAGRTLSICSEMQLVDQVPKESFDLPVQMMITEKRIIDTTET